MFTMRDESARTRFSTPVPRDRTPIYCMWQGARSQMLWACRWLSVPRIMWRRSLAAIAAFTLPSQIEMDATLPAVLPQLLLARVHGGSGSYTHDIEQKFYCQGSMRHFKVSAACYAFPTLGAPGKFAGGGQLSRGKGTCL